MEVDDYEALIILICNCVEQKQTLGYKNYILRAKRKSRNIIEFLLYKDNVLINKFVINYLKETFCLEVKSALESESIEEILTLCLNMGEIEI